jgi:hypothetical protein
MRGFCTLIAVIIAAESSGLAGAVCSEVPTGDSQSCATASLPNSLASIQPLVVDNPFAAGVVDGFEGARPVAVLGPFEEDQFCFHSIEVFVETTTLWRVLGYDNMTSEWQVTRLRTQIIFALKGSDWTSFWRYHLRDEPYIESKRPYDDVDGFRVAGVELENTKSVSPVLRIDFLSSNMTMGGRTMAGAGSVSVDFRYAQPYVIGIFSYPPLVEIPTWMGTPSKDCRFNVFDRELLCVDAELTTVPWVRLACR